MIGAISDDIKVLSFCEGEYSEYYLGIRLQPIDQKLLRFHANNIQLAISKTPLSSLLPATKDYGARVIIAWLNMPTAGLYATKANWVVLC
jgi:hypothetical protein